MTGKSKIAFWSITLIIVFGLLTFMGYMVIDEYNEEVIFNNLTESGYEKILTNENSDLLTIVKSQKYGLMTTNGVVLEECIYEQKDIVLGYDNYYRIITSDGRTLIKRNGNLVKDITDLTDSYVLLKDANDKYSSYIVYESDNKSFTTTQINDNVYVSNVMLNNNYYARIIDIDEGIIKEFDGYVGKVLMQNNLIDKYLIQVKDNKVNLLNIFDYNVILEDYTRIGDEDNISGYVYSGKIINDNYITVCKDKCGIINNNGDVIVPTEYDDIKEVEQVEPNYYAIKIKEKYGVVDKDNKIVVEPIYDDLYAYNNIFVLISDNKLKIIDVKLNRIYETNITVNDKISSELINDEYIKLQIHDMSNAGTPRKYIIIDKDNNVKEYKYEEIIEIDNSNNKMSEELYATYDIKNNEIYIRIYNGLTLLKEFTVIETEELKDVYLYSVSSNELLLKIDTNKDTNYTLLNINTGNMVINNALKNLNIRNNDFVVDIEEGTLIYYRNDLLSKHLEDGVISVLKIKNDKYIIRKLDNVEYLYQIDKR